VLQVNCKSTYNKILDFWDLIDTYNPDVIIGTESWRSDSDVRHPRCVLYNSKELGIVILTVEHNYICLYYYKEDSPPPKLPKNAPRIPV